MTARHQGVVPYMEAETVDYPEDLSESFRELSGFLAVKEGIDPTLGRIATLSVAVIPSCD